MDEPIIVDLELEFPEDRYLSVAELREYCGVSKAAICRYMSGVNSAPSFSAGGRRLIRRSEFDAWLQAKRRWDALSLEEKLAPVLEDVYAARGFRPRAGRAAVRAEPERPHLCNCALCRERRGEH